MASANGFAVTQEYVDVETAKQTGRAAFGEMVSYSLPWDANTNSSHWKTDARLPDFRPKGDRSGKLRQVWIARN
jgi:hypothetical protein